ncbi:HD-GYP domain-containing protein [Azospirillum sp. TSH58]|uniref:HD-GYP domain-containing protein n=1 Tax=Azospirillum sp. TSH58 TaxID=664962 RepID=UPI000D607E3C|nr:hypothetical protein TSH58_08250 [Azospirillum sp. TSH58]
MPIYHVAISLEARIVAVADVFDALTSERPYKGAWTNEAAAAFLWSRRPGSFNPDYVAALLADMSAIAAIQQHFCDTPSSGFVAGR